MNHVSVSPETLAELNKRMNARHSSPEQIAQAKKEAAKQIAKRK